MKVTSWLQAYPEDYALLQQALECYMDTDDPFQDNNPDGCIIHMLVRMAQKFDLREIINQTDSNGDTVLHLALQSCSLAIIAMLVRLGADLFTANHKKITPVILISQLAADVQLFILRQANRDNRENILQFYRELLAQDPNLVHARNAYCRFAGLHEQAAAATEN